MENNQKKIEDVHHLYNEIVLDAETQLKEKASISKFPYEFLLSVDKGWIPCDVTEVDSNKELVKIICYHPDSSGWMDTCAGGVFDTVVESWRVRVREV